MESTNFNCMNMNLFGLMITRKDLKSRGFAR